MFFKASFLLFIDRRIQQMRERDELKYSAEEKIVEDSESDDENVRRSVAERREKIVKRLSIERQIPASTQKKEIDQEITEIKRKSLIEDKKAIHEEEIMLQMPTDNIIKSAVVPDQIRKLKTNKVETPDVSKTEFDKELQDKFKKTVKLMDEADTEDLIEETSKIVYDSTVTEKAIKTESMIVKEEQILPTTIIEDEVKIRKEDIPIDDIISGHFDEFRDKAKEISPEKIFKEETIKTKETISTTKRQESTKEEGIGKGETPKEFETVKIEETITREDALLKEETIRKEDTKKIEEATKIEEAVKKEELAKLEETIRTGDVTHIKDELSKKVSVEITEASKLIDEDLEQKLLKQKEKIDKHLQETTEQIQKTSEIITVESDKHFDEFVPKSYSEKPRESLTEAEFYKSIEETITKKMSEGLIQISDDILSSGE